MRKFTFVAGLYVMSICFLFIGSEQLYRYMQFEFFY
jgi:hypothetical protein